jgi:glycerophosphoryl diester phosphodiesterase
VKIIGHRGQVDPDGAPENTLDAVETALSGGADGIEVDVRLTADGVPVCVHDPDLRRIGGRAVAVDRATYAQVRAVPLRESSHPRP